MTTIFRTILSQAILAKMFKMAQMAVMEWYNMATYVVVIGVYGKSGKNADHPWKRNWKNCNGSKVMAKSKYTLKSGPFSFVFWPEISTSLRDPLGCSDLSQIFFGSSPIATEWDKIVAEIIHTTFVFLRHPNHTGMGNIIRSVLHTRIKIYKVPNFWPILAQLQLKVKKICQ